MSRPAWLQPLRHASSWLSLWWLAIAVVLVASLAPPRALPPIADGSDKLYHLLGYFVLAAVAVQLFRRGAGLWWVAAGLVLMGIAVEWAQGALTAQRSADPLDALANAAGVALGMALAFTPARHWLQRLERWPARRGR